MRGIPNSLKTSLRQLLAMYVVAVLFNYPWERVQSSLYVGMDGANVASWLCLVASLIDGLLVLVIFTVGCIILRRRDWFENPGVRGYVLMLAMGLAISVIVEWATVHVAHWWSYTEQMPLVPWLGVGLLPVAQMLFFPPLIFRIVAFWRHW